MDRRVHLKMSTNIIEIIFIIRNSYLREPSIYILLRAQTALRLLLKGLLQESISENKKNAKTFFLATGVAHAQNLLPFPSWQLLSRVLERRLPRGAFESHDVTPATLVYQGFLMYWNL